MSNAKQTIPSALDRMTHGIINRLTVIHVCSCQLRQSIAEKLEPDELKEFNRLEVAVLEAADMIHQLPSQLCQSMSIALAGDHSPRL